MKPPLPDRRVFQLTVCGAFAMAATGCISGGDPGKLSGTIWGRRGISDGRLQKPRAIAVGPDNQLFIADMTGRIQVFTINDEGHGDFVRGWSMPKIDTGRPVGLSMHPDGNLMVADTHNFRIMFYTADGEHLPDRTIGGTFGREPGEFGLVTDVVVDSVGNYFISEYGDNDRIQKFDPTGKFVCQFGSHGSAPDQFLRPQNLAIDTNDRLYVTDACNHQVKIFDIAGDSAKLVHQFGEQGTLPGQLRYPYGLALQTSDDAANPVVKSICVCEFGNHRVQRFSITGEPLEMFGVHGRRGLGEFQQPWALALDTKHRLHVLDSYNHRVQSIQV